jgi:hypothetical protein
MKTPRVLQIGNRQSAVGNVMAVSKRPAMESEPSVLTEVGNMGSVPLASVAWKLGMGRTRRRKPN